MKPTLLTAIVLAAVLAPATHAEARGPKPKPAPPSASNTDADDAARVAGNAAITEYIFGNEDVDGLVLRPEGMPVPAQARVRFPSLLHIRGHFVPELVRMAKDL
jgi:hypothetical protein